MPLTFKGWSVDVKLLESHIVEIAYKGSVPAEALSHVNKELRNVLRGRKDVTGWLVDSLETTHFGLAPTKAMIEVLELFRTHGGKRFAAATNLGMLKMIASAFRFSKVVPIQIFDNRVDAIAYLKDLKTT